MRYAIVIERSDSLMYRAYCPDVPTCTITGITVEETVARMQDAVKEKLETLAERGEKMPGPQAATLFAVCAALSRGDLLAFVDVKTFASSRW